MKVLIVDSLAMFRAMLRKILENGFFSGTIEAENRKQALIVHHKERPNIVIVDVSSPHTQGLELIGDLLSIDPKARIIVSSNAGQKEKVVEAYQKGARHFLLKPFDQNKVLETVRSSLLNPNMVKSNSL